MSELMVVVFGAAVLVGTLMGFMALAGVLHLTSKRTEGWLHLGIHGALLGLATMVLTSGRDISNGSDAGVAVQAAGLSSIATLVIRLVTGGFVLLAAERIASTLIRASSGERLSPRPRLLLPAFVCFWLATTLAPAFLGAHGAPFKHETLYTLLIGIAFILSSAQGAERVLFAARDGLAWFSIAGLVTVLVKPSLVLDSNYMQGLIPGLPRFTGLVPHAVTYGLALQVGMYCLWARPYARRWFNTVAWAVFLVSLVMAQSKTAWSSTLVCVLLVAATNYRAVLARALLNPVKPMAGALLLGIGLFCITSIALTLLFADIDGVVNGFLASEEGASITSLTGRDRIWEIALQEWAKYPIFGYGATLFDESFRTQIGISSAVHAHNQFVDTLARAGLVGATCLMFYLVVLLFWALRYAQATGGLSVLLCAALYLRSISEVPFVMTGYGSDFIAHVLLLAVICGAHQQRQTSSAAKQDLRRLRTGSAPERFGINA